MRLVNLFYLSLSWLVSSLFSVDDVDELWFEGGASHEEPVDVGLSR